MMTSRYTKLRLFFGTVTAVCLLNMILGCRQESPTTKSLLLSNTQLGVIVRAPTQSGWTMLKSNERETRFQGTIANEIVVASSQTLMASEFGEGDDLLARLESWKESQLVDSGLKRDSLHFYRLRFKGMACLGYDGVYQSGSESENHFNFRGYLFPLISTEQSAVELEFSSRSKQRGFSEELIQTSEKFFEAATLTPAM